MGRVRRGIGWGLAAALVSVGIIGVVITHAAWTPCEGYDYTDVCLATMDHPSHVPAVAALWLVALGLTVCAVLALRTVMARALGFSALSLVLVMNGGTDYVILLGIAGGHHDLPPGTGYPMALAFIVAGILVAAGVVTDASRRLAGPVNRSYAYAFAHRPH